MRTVKYSGGMRKSLDDNAGCRPAARLRGRAPVVRVETTKPPRLVRMWQRVVNSGDAFQFTRIGRLDLFGGLVRSSHTHQKRDDADKLSPSIQTPQILYFVKTSKPLLSFIVSIYYLITFGEHSIFIK